MIESMMDADATAKIYVPQLTAPRRPLGEHEREDARQAALLVLTGPLLGTVFPLTRSPTVVGRGDDAHVRLIAEGVSRQHAWISRQGRRYYIEDAGSRNGTWVNRRLVRRAMLSEGDQIRVGAATVLKFFVQDPVEEHFRRQLHESALCDPLTKVFNKRYFLERLQGELAFVARHGGPLSLLLLDVDRFKVINDRHGHLLGDQALCSIAEAVRASIRGEDVLCRYGGEEFAVLCRGVGRAGARAFAERVRRTVASVQVEDRRLGQRVPLTVSVGGVELPEDLLIGGEMGIDQVAEWLIEKADEALYQAKAAGRDCVKIIP
jgi:diguanylate cyclase (GGDEF)-like protein